MMLRIYSWECQIQPKITNSNILIVIVMTYMNTGIVFGKLLGKQPPNLKIWKTFYRHVTLSADISKIIPKTHLLTETEWRNIGIQQSPDWEHYMTHIKGINWIHRAFFLGRNRSTFNICLLNRISCFII
jgi:hypothetical protein